MRVNTRQVDCTNPNRIYNNKDIYIYKYELREWSVSRSSFNVNIFVNIIIDILEPRDWYISVNICDMNSCNSEYKLIYEIATNAHAHFRT